MGMSTQLVAGLASGFDWRTMIDQLMEIEHKPVDLVEERKSDYESQLSEWQSFNTKLLALKTAAGALQDPEDFYVYTTSMTSSDADVDASDLLSVTTSTTASKGSYALKVNALATAEKLSSASFSSLSDALGASYAGDILINGTAISITATDGLDDVRDRINDANAGSDPTGVTASIITYGTNDYRLILTSDNTGADGISLQNGSANDLIQLFGWKDYSTSLKNSITDGAQSDAFTSTTTNIKTLLGLSTTQSGTIQVDGNNVSIDLSTDTLESIKTKIDALSGVSASIVTDTSGSTTTYRLQVDGTQSFTDGDNILETLGILKNGAAAINGTVSGNSMTADGSYITASTLLTDIDGYHTFTAGDTISLGATSRDHGNNDISGDILTITTSSTVQDLLDAIETAYETNGYEAAVRVTSDGKIEITDLETGSSSMVADLQSTLGDGDSSLDWGSFTSLSQVRERQLVAGQDASIQVDGVTATSSDNTVDDVITGVTLNLLKADTSTTVTLNINRDIDSVMDKISTFVDAYNEVFSYIYQQQSYNADNEETGGILFGDSTLSSVKTDLSSALLETVWGVSSDFSALSLVGIDLDDVTTGEDYAPKLSIDTDTLRGYLQTNFTDVMSLFILDGTTSSGQLEYISASRETESGEFTVAITQAASRSTATSDNGTVGENETLTITEGDKVAEIALTTSMTLSDIKNAINSELSQTHTETLIGDQQLYDGSGGTTALSSSTTWDQVYLDASNSANVTSGDQIAFSGTTRTGVEVSGTYSITSASTQTVQGLLSAIETAFDNDVTASIDSSGKLVVTDKYSGYSQLSLTLDYTDAHDLTFGSSVSTTNTGGQEGRYAMEITATDDGSHLILTHDNYGSAYSFTISESAASSANKLWTGGDQTVNNGLDVTGTINGEAATGAGQILSGDDGEANVDGLVIKYTGTGTGSNVGSVTVTVGVAELFDRILYNITDTFDGYAALKQEFLQDRIDDLETDIEDMEARLDRKMQNMINRFVAMEAALSAMQSQSQWLAGQLSATNSAWA
ncbi:MAG: flagellar filament capping protein FliD [Deltaproteobacteria bacterium]|nr:flagellar filament capping protein FliD [Deltaproteobacteria bacterium]